MLKLTAETMTAAIARAKTVRPKVRVISADQRTYAVTGSKGDIYTVKFAVANGHKLAECNCPARGMCFHIAAAAQVNVMVQSMRRQAAPAPAAPVSERQSLIRDIRQSWPATWPPLATELMRRFRVNTLDYLAEDMLRGVLAAIA